MSINMDCDNPTLPSSQTEIGNVPLFKATSAFTSTNNLDRNASDVSVSQMIHCLQGHVTDKDNGNRQKVSLNIDTRQPSVFEEKLLELTRENHLLRSKLELQQNICATPRLSFSDTSQLHFFNPMQLERNSAFNPISQLMNPSFFMPNTSHIPINQQNGLSANHPNAPLNYGPSLPTGSQSSLAMPNLTSHQDFLMLPSALKSTNSFPNILPNGEATLFHYAQRNNSLDKMLDNDATFQQLKNKHHYGDSDNMNNNSLGLRSTSISLNDNKNNNLTLNGQNNTVKSIPVATVSGITSGQAKIEAAREAITSQGILNAHAFPTLLSTLLSSNPTQPTQPRSPSVPESATEHRSGLFSTREKENSADILSINMNSTASKNDSDSAGSPHSISDSNHSMASPSNSGDSANSVNYGDRGYEKNFQYIDRRRRNNEAAKRCRANRRAVFEYRSRRAQQLEQENEDLKQEIVKLNKDLCTLRELITYQDSST